MWSVSLWSLSCWFVAWWANTVGAAGAAATSNYSSVDTAVSSNYSSGDTAVSSNYSSADTAVSSNYSSADTAVSSNYSSVDTATSTGNPGPGTVASTGYPAAGTQPSPGLLPALLSCDREIDSSSEALTFLLDAVLAPFAYTHGDNQGIIVGKRYSCSSSYMPIPDINGTIQCVPIKPARF